MIDMHPRMPEFNYLHLKIQKKTYSLSILTNEGMFRHSCSERCHLPTLVHNLSNTDTDRYSNRD